MLDKLKIKKKDKSPKSNIVQQDLLVDELVGFRQVEEEPQQKKPKKSKKALYIILGCVVALVLPFSLISNSFKVDKQKEIESFKQYEAKMKSNPHTSLAFHVKHSTNADALEATALLVGHVLDTGCTLGYDQLREVFEDKSLKYLYSYLTGTSCDPYVTAKVVCVKEGDTAYEFMSKITRTGEKKKITVYHEKFEPLEFKVEKYIVEE